MTLPHRRSLAWLALVASLASCAAGCSPSNERAGTSTSTSASVKKPQGVLGIWVGEHFESHYQPNFGPSGGGYWQNSTTRYQYWLREDGTAKTNLPTGGFDQSTFDDLCEAKPKDCGTWAKQGKEVIITWSDPSRSQTVLEVWSDDVLSIGGTQLVKIGAYDGVALDGVYTYVNYTQSAVGDVSTDSKTVKSLTLGADGTFEASSSFLTTVSSSQVGGVSSRTKGGAGRYQIAGNTLTLVFDDGEELPCTFWTVTDDASLIAVDGLTYRRRE